MSGANCKHYFVLKQNIRVASLKKGLLHGKTTESSIRWFHLHIATCREKSSFGSFFKHFHGKRARIARLQDTGTVTTRCSWSRAGFSSHLGAVQDQKPRSFASVRVRIFGDCITPALPLSQTQCGCICFNLFATLGLEGPVPREGIRQNN